MQFVKCEMPGCDNYIAPGEAKVVEYEGRQIYICDECDDDTLKSIKTGGAHAQANKIEKIKKRPRFI